MEVVWRSPGRRDLRRLDPPDQRRVIAAVERYAKTGQGDVVRLRGAEPPQSRLRVGRWRVRILVEGRVLHVLRVLPRPKAYR